MQRPHRIPHGPLREGPMTDLLLWVAIGLIVLFNVVMMWRIATATV